MLLSRSHHLKEDLFIVDTRRYGLLSLPTFSSCGGLWSLAKAFFFTIWEKKGYYACLAPFRPLLVFTNFEKSFHHLGPLIFFNLKESKNIFILFYVLFQKHKIRLKLKKIYEKFQNQKI